MEASIAKKSLVSKLAEIGDAIGGVEKKGRNEHQKYSYVKAADVAKLIRHELFKRQIVLIADEKKVEQVAVKTLAGGIMRHLTLTVEYKLYDGESGETISATAYGIAMDSGDKAIYKAKTGALKYFLRGLGIIPDEKDDPEFDEDVDDLTDPRLAHKPSAGKSRQPIAEFQARAWETTARASGKTADQIAAYLRQKFDVLRVADLSKSDFNEAIKWAAASPENLTQDLETSVAAARKKQTRVVPLAADEMTGD